MHLSTVRYYVREFKYLKTTLKRYGDRLVTGKYHAHPGHRAVCLNDPETIATGRVYFDKTGTSGRIVSIIEMLNKFGYYKNKNRKSTQEYEAFYSANNHDALREVKLFSFRRKKMLAICTDAESAKKQLEGYDLFGGAYPMPAVKKDDSYPNAIEISMVDMKARPKEAEALESIIDSTIAFNSDPAVLHTESARELIAFSYDNEEMSALLGGLAARIDESVLSMNIPLCMQHGDLSKDNLIYGDADGKSGFWWIDWEHARDRAFFYDFFFYILNSAMYYDTEAYEAYMSGEIDEALKRFLTHFGNEFVPEKRKDYYLLFAVIFLKERVCALGNLQVLKRYLELIGKNDR